MQCHLQSKNGIYFVPSSAGEHSPQTFTLVGGGGQGRLQTSWKTGARMGTKGAPGLSPPAPVHLGGTTSPLLWCCKDCCNALPSPILASSNLTSPSLSSSNVSGFHCPYTAVGWGWPFLEGMAGPLVGSRSWVSYRKKGPEKRLSAGCGSRAA